MSRKVVSICIYILFTLMTSPSTFAQDSKDDRAESLLLNVAKKGNVDSVKAMLMAGANVNAADNDGVTPLIFASGGGLVVRPFEGFTEETIRNKEMYVALVKTLIDSGADVNTASHDEYLSITPLMAASQSGLIEIVQILLKADADVNKECWDAYRMQTTALMCAARNGHKKIVKILLSANANVNASRNGFTALFYAATHGYSDIVKVLIDAGADVNTAGTLSFVGWTALMSASEYGHIDIVQILLNSGADLNAKNQDGQTALMIAQDHGHADIVQLLKQAGSKK